ncbi:unnamed protein product [Symbiodinium natans]|uniref:Uncharacterized protein n=1 Tax=Symbiodinium natans TaxID=878477 RepID=A0A812V0G7_9DINO|nr:unnamed protein product [Symbiodinium natans]
MSAAYQVLSDPKQRADFDRFGKGAEHVPDPNDEWRQGLKKAKKIVTATEQEITRLVARSKKMSKKLSAEMQKLIQKLQSEPKYVAAKRFVVDCAAERAKQRQELLASLEAAATRPADPDVEARMFLRCS